MEAEKLYTCTYMPTQETTKAIALNKEVLMHARAQHHCLQQMCQTINMSTTRCLKESSPILSLRIIVLDNYLALAIWSA